jgi:Fe-S oxidoreductase
MPDNTEIIMSTGAYACLDCGKCTAVCPISRYDPDYSPRKIVYSITDGKADGIVTDGRLWSCITCYMCEQRCQSGVRYTELIKSLRVNSYQAGCHGECTHGGALQSLMHIMTADSLRQNRLDWVSKDLKVTDKADVLYFVGCQPYFDVVFSDLKVKSLETAKGAVKLLNRLDIVPALLPNERCCGHDLLWSGHTGHFMKLAEHNLKEIQKLGAKQVVTTCPEGYLTLKYEYPRYFGSIDFEVVHITELLAEAIKNGKLQFRRLNRKVTYHDPCRLGRFEGIYDAPRTIINAIPDVELVEMPRNRANALCCGTQAWINCGTINKQIQDERLREAVSTGADVLLTSCPKCKIHFTCALSNGRLEEATDLRIEDIVSLAARQVQG